MEEASSSQPIDLRDILRPVTSRLWLIIIVVAVATGLTYYHYSHQPKQYRASTELYIGSTDPTQLVNPSASPRETTDLAGLVNSSGVASLVGKALHYRGNPLALMAGVSASASSSSDFVTITDISGNPALAAATANAVANAFIASEANTIRQEANQAIGQAKQELKVLPNTLGNSTQRGQLGETIQQMENIETLPSAGIKHLNPAYPPGAPFAPDPKKSAVFAFVISLLLSIAGAFGLERLDRRIRKLIQVEKAYGNPILATVPRSRKPAPSAADGTVLLPDDAREPYRKLRTNLGLATLGHDLKVLVVTSAVPREGKSTVSRNLALAYREAGLEVCLVDADLRRPGLARLLSVDSEPGVTDVVVGDETLSNALQPVSTGVPGLRTLGRLQTPLPSLPLIRDGEPKERKRSTDRLDEKIGDVGSLAILPSGPEPANPPVVLGSDQMRSILDSLREVFDLVIIDTSPLLAVTDAVPLLSAADGVVLVSRVGMTTTDAAEDVVDQIRRIPGANLLGVVANDVHGRDAGIKKYAYGYGYTDSRVVA